MAENDDADLGSPEFIEQITSACAAKQKGMVHTNGPIQQQTFDSTLMDSRLHVPRQHSLDSSCGSKCSRSSRSREDLLDAKTRFNRSKLRRQATVDYSDDGDVPISAQSSFDHDHEDENGTDYDIVSPDTVLINQYNSETSFSRPAFRPPLRKNQSCTTYANINSSLGDLLNVQSRNKSKSLMTMRKMLSETRNDEEIKPVTEEAIAKILGDNLLDRNMADILYSVEALWPKYRK